MKSIADALRGIVAETLCVTCEVCGVSTPFIKTASGYLCQDHWPKMTAAEQHRIAKTVPTGKILKYGETSIHTYGDIDCAHDWGECHPSCVHLSWTREPITPYGNCSLFKRNRLGKCRCSHGSGAIRCRECYEATKRLIWQ